MTPLVVGIDPSLTATGIARDTDAWCMTILTVGEKNPAIRDRCQRLQRIANEIVTIACDAELVVIEQPAFSKHQGSAHDRSGLWWLVVAALLDVGVSVAEVPPTTLKKYATGRGNANKGAMCDALARRLPAYATGGDDNAVDAVWLAAMGADHLGRPLVAVPSLHREALAKVQWPDLERT